MGDLYLHLGFARRVRFADGLHPIAVEALVRAPGAVILGATLPYLPELEHKGASFFRRLFMPGKQKRAFWQTALEPAGSPSLDLALAVMSQGKGSQPGSMARFGLGLGVLCHQVLHAQVADLTAELEGAPREAMRRALARVWLEQAVPDTSALAAELKPALSLEDSGAHKALVEHLNAALREAHGEPPGGETLWRWVRGLCADVEPLVEHPALPPSLAVSDDDARARHEDALREAVDEARRWFVFLVNRLAPLFLQGDPSREEMRAALVDEGDALRRPGSDDEAPSAARFHDEVAAVRDEHMTRGRNPKPAFDEVSGASGLAPPASMPPVPDDASGPLLQVPAHTQEVSVADIESELQSQAGLEVPAHTQEVSVAQIEEQLAEAAPPPKAPTSTQQVSLDDIQEELAAQAPSASPPPPPAPTSTQQVSLEQIEAELEGASVPAPQEQAAPFLAGAVPVPPPPPSVAPANGPGGAQAPTAAPADPAAPPTVSPAGAPEAAPDAAAEPANGAPPSDAAPDAGEPKPTEAAAEKVREGTDPSIA